MGDLFVIHDALDSILLGAFFFGLVFSALALVLGAINLPGGHAGQVHGNGAHVGHGHGGHHGHDSEVSILNLSTILAFVTWFGGSAYLIRNGLSLPAVVGVLGGIAGGVIGAYLVFRILLAVKRQETYLDASRERLTGSLARVTSPIRDGGTGEIVYELNGVRQVSAARSVDGTALPRGSEVIVLKRERGIALVESSAMLDGDADWERRFELTAGGDLSKGPPGERELTEHRVTP